MEEGEREEQSSLRPLVQHSLPNSTDVTVVTTKKETFGECERNDEMKKQEKTALVVEGCRQVGSFGGFFLFLSLLESCASLVPCSLVHNSSSVNHGSLSQSEKQEANSTPKGPHSLSFLCLISLFEFKYSFLFWFYSSDHDQNTYIYTSNCICRAEICTHTTCVTHLIPLIIALYDTIACLTTSKSIKAWVEVIDGACLVCL